MTSPAPPARLAPDPECLEAKDPAGLPAVHTPNVPALSRHLGASLLVTTNQASNLVLVCDEGTTSTSTFALSRLLWAWPSPASGWHSAPRSIPITERLTADERTCAVEVQPAQVVALWRFKTAAQEVFAVTVLPRRRHPELTNDDETLLENPFVVPDASLADVSAAPRAPSGPIRGAAVATGNGGAPRTSVKA
jgi:hypothetical protein